MKELDVQRDKKGSC